MSRGWRALVFAMVWCLVAGTAGAEAMKILGPDGQDITTKMQSLMEDNPTVMREMSRLFKEVENARNKQGAAGSGSGSGSGSELFINWAIKIDANGKAYLVDEGHPETSQQFPLAGGARMFNYCTMRKISGSGSGSSASGTGLGGSGGGTGAGGSLAGNNQGGGGAGTGAGGSGTGVDTSFPNAGNGFSANGFGTNWNNPGSGNANAGLPAGADSGYQVDTDFNKVDIGVKDVTPPNLTITIEMPGQSSSLLTVQPSKDHQPVLKLPAQTSPRDFYTNNSASPFNTRALAESGYLQTKVKKVRGEGVVFDPSGRFTTVEHTVSARGNADWSRFESQLTPSTTRPEWALYVPEDVRFKIMVEAADEDEVYKTIQPPEGQQLNAYNQSVNRLGDAFTDYMRTTAAQAQQAQQQNPNYAFNANDPAAIAFPGVEKNSVKWKIVQRDGGSTSDYLVPTDNTISVPVMFRNANYQPGSVDYSRYAYALVAEATDKAGNKTSIEMPIWVTSVSFGSKVMESGGDRK